MKRPKWGLWYWQLLCLDGIAIGGQMHAIQTHARWVDF